MKWFDLWFYNQAKKAWENKDRYEIEEDSKRILSMKEKRTLNMAIGGQAMVERGAPEGESVIRFEISSAVGGKIVTVRRNDPRKDHYDQTTYVIPTGEDLGERIAKIVNMEQYKG